MTFLEGKMMKLITTDDGSNTVLIPSIGETYHSTFGAIQESEHVFIEAGLRLCCKKRLTLLEVGFGSGLNAYLTMIYAVNNDLEVHYHAVERYPIDDAMASELNFVSRYGRADEFASLHRAEWNVEVRINDRFFITKHLADFTAMDRLPQFDVCYFDAFSPDKQPEMWALDRFELLYRYAEDGAILTTYCAKGQVRRNMQQAGFVVERIQGAKGKREMLRAKKAVVK